VAHSTDILHGCAIIVCHWNPILHTHAQRRIDIGDRAFASH
jgi:hypothetical protein